MLFGQRPHKVDRVEQAVIMVNVRVEKDLYLNRQNNTGRDASKLLGNATKVQEVNVISGEPIVIPRNAHMLENDNDGGKPWNYKVPCFSSFTGYYAGEAGAHYDDAFVFLGFAAIQKGLSNSESSVSDGQDLSVIVGGITSTDNNGGKTIPPMSLVKWRGPSLNPKIRSKENANRPTAYGPPSTKLTPILEPYTYRDQRAWSDKSIDWFMKFSNQRTLMSRLYRIDHNGKIPKRDPIEQIGSAFAELVANTVVSCLSVLDQYGLVTINPNSLDWKNLSIYNRIRETIKDNSVNTLKGKKLEWSTNGSASVASDDRPEVERLNRLNRLGFIAALMGHSPDGNRDDTLYPSLELMKAFVGRSFHGMEPDESVRDKYDIMPHIIPDGLRKRSFGDGKPTFASGMISSLESLRNNSASNLLNAIIMMKMLAEERVIGISANVSEPKKRLHVFK